MEASYHAAAELRLLQSLHRFGAGYRAHLRLVPDRTVSIHSGARRQQQGDQLALTLNTPPSFHNPKSVIVVALPAVEQAQLSAAARGGSKGDLLRAQILTGAAGGRCAAGFLDAYAHDLTLRLTGEDGDQRRAAGPCGRGTGRLRRRYLGLVGVILGDRVTRLAARPLGIRQLRRSEFSAGQHAREPGNAERGSRRGL